ncbi:LysR family transcriptional regulator [Vibrio neptunius]|uniref:LysR family transcriptional regulator n=1 Tax=Vibrio neptunius TaxID=170651 RepID=A0ABS3A4T0_9VIBR|nr:LysR family transcriptional regulator [Vibrio neptunius]MBN3494072.1 LysR family transcriptional regulator [Vibrio neptunius]MBN3516569.1 LysR family transcriptional regulator [Vibrio neptunius]MBN3550743.1 LysR family transcriptional regulator [Vibrio neptunius]MBN3578874.1 LysR family transcriptional regulator [Vibrio neptunius]MCH9872539.1 LysR family transcriptional regulator [Vibrio neptunius]
MDLEASLWFSTVVRMGSFSKAASELGVPTSTVSRRIANLESQLGTTLLVRNTRSMQVTQSGNEYLMLTKQLEMGYQSLKDWQDNQSQVSGTFRITAPLQFVDWPLSDWVIEFKSTYPKLNIELVGSNENLDFYEDRIDIAFRQGPLSDSDLRQRRLFELQYGIYASPSWLNKHGDCLDFAWLQAQEVVNIGVKGKSFPWLIKHNNKLHTIIPKSGLLLESPQQAVRAAKAELGLIYVPYFDAHSAIAKGEIVPVCESLWPDGINFYLVFHKSRTKSKKLSTFIDFILDKQKELMTLPGIC